VTTGAVGNVTVTITVPPPTPASRISMVAASNRTTKATGNRGIIVPPDARREKAS
jgi:hypothetical protein